MYNKFRNNYFRNSFYEQAEPYGYQAAVMAEMAANNVNSNSIFVYPQNMNNALAIMQQAISGENEDRKFYTWLIENATSNEDKQIIAGIRDNEIHHFGLFRQLYQELTGKMAPPPQDVAFIPPATYCDGLSRALLGEQNAVQKYRQILYAMQDRVHINILTEIITDEIRHGILYNFLFAKNACRN